MIKNNPALSPIAENRERKLAGALFGKNIIGEDKICYGFGHQDHSVMRWMNVVIRIYIF